MKKYILFSILFLFSTGFSFASFDSIPERPYPARWVNNLSKEMPGFLSSDEEAKLEKKLADFANQTSNQIVIVIVDDLGGFEPWSYATELGHKWGVGQKKLDNGVIILIKPTGKEGTRKLFIAVGYGLEGSIPDLTTKQIRENEMNPHFKKGEYYAGLDKATDVLMALAKGDYNFNSYSDKNKNNITIIRNWMLYGGFGFFLLVFLLVLLFGVRNGGNITLSSHGNSSDFNYSNSDSYSGSDSSDSSSSSSDFGGGDFGGGGSGGDW